MLQLLTGKSERKLYIESALTLFAGFPNLRHNLDTPYYPDLNREIRGIIHIVAGANTKPGTGYYVIYFD